MSIDSFHRSLQRSLDRDQGGPPVVVDPPMTAEEEEEHLPDPEYCTALVYPGTLESPPEYCENEAEPDEELCYRHLPWDEF